jgi:hypothetical protein
MGKTTMMNYFWRSKTLSENGEKTAPWLFQFHVLDQCPVPTLNKKDKKRCIRKDKTKMKTKLPKPNHDLVGRDLLLLQQRQQNHPIKNKRKLGFFL